MGTCKPNKVRKDHLGSLIDEYLLRLEVSKKPQTVSHARLTLTMFLSYCHRQQLHYLQDLTPSLIMQWFLSLRAGRSQATVWSYATDLRAFLNWCMQEGLLNQPILKSSDYPRKPLPQPKPLDTEDIQRILDAIPQNSWISERNRAIVLTLLHTAARRGEVLQMRVADAKGGIVQVIQKGGRPHVLMLSKECQMAILKYLRFYERETGHKLQPNDALWRSPNGKELSENGLRLVMRRLSERSGVHVWCHRLRGTSATLRLLQGASTEAVRAMLGHTSEESIRYYVNLAQQHLQRIAEETSPLKLIRWRKVEQPKKRTHRER